MLRDMEDVWVSIFSADFARNVGSRMERPEIKSILRKSSLLWLVPMLLQDGYRIPDITVPFIEMTLSPPSFLLYVLLEKTDFTTSPHFMRYPWLTKGLPLHEVSYHQVSIPH